MGYDVPAPIRITNTFPLTTVYYLIWATNGQGYNIIENRIIPWIKTLMDKAQGENEIAVIKANAEKQKIKPLSNYFEVN